MKQALRERESIATAAQKLTSWCQTEALPLWASAGRNPEGGFYEQLTPDGKPDKTTDIRVRVNVRQIYAFSHAHCNGWFEGSQTVARETFQYLKRYCMAKAGTAGNIPVIAYKISPDHTVVDDHIDLYSQAFMFLATAWLHRATSNNEPLGLARQTCNFLDEKMVSIHGGWIESISGPSLPRRQNPHMHLFEGFLALYESTGDPYYLEHADHVFALFQRHFLDKKHGVLREHFTVNWKPDPQMGDLIEPGHMMEWAWLLSIYARHKRIDLYTEISTLYNQALERGLNPETGLLWDEMRISGEVTKPTHRSWSLTEYLKATIAMACLGNSEAQLRIPDLVDLLFSSYLEQPVKGGWIDQLDADGQVISNTMPASTLYHYVCACAELDEYSRENILAPRFSAVP